MEMKKELHGDMINEINGSTVPTFKAISEAEMEEEATTQPKNLYKPANKIQDGAEEKMLSMNDNEKGNINSNVIDVKISGNDKQNGDAKLDIGELKNAFVGLTKEELMKYANDPFWVRLRWFLLLLFWALWLAMLLGAVIIIYAAPKCDSPAPRTWWQQGPLSEILSDKTVDQLKEQKSKGLQGLIMTWPEDTYTSIDENHEFIKLLKQAKDKNINIIVTLDPSYSLKWFNQSVQKQGNYSDYYIWREAKTNNQPPNNWLNRKNQSSWLYSNERREFYYAPKGQPQLNFFNKNVSNEFISIIKKFLNYGASGISLKSVSGLLVDPTFNDEPIKPNNPGVLHTEYGFYTHSKTENIPELKSLLMEWRSVIKKNNSITPFISIEEHQNEDYIINNTFIFDLPQIEFFNINDFISPLNIVKRLDEIFKKKNIEWPLWKYNSINNDVNDIIVYLLPGTPLISENAPINNDLLNIRNMPSIMRGILTYQALNNNTVFAFIRVTAGNPGILVAYNPSDDRQEVDFPKHMKMVSEEVTVQLLSKNYTDSEYGLNIKYSARSISISPHSVIVLSYVPKV